MPQAQADSLRESGKPGFQAQIVLKKYPLDDLNGLSPLERQARMSCRARFQCCHGNSARPQVNILKVYLVFP